MFLPETSDVTVRLNFLAAATEPNWFYSTLAQSTAAIVGLAGGFLVSRLIARREEISAERAALVAQFETIVSQFSGEGQRQLDLAQQIENTLEGDVDQWPLYQGPQRGYGETASHTSYGVDPPTEEDIAALRALPALYREAAPSFEAVDRGTVARATLNDRPLESQQGWLGGDEQENPYYEEGIGPENYWRALTEQRVWLRWRWTDLNRSYGVLRQDTQAFRQRLIPKSIYVLLAILACLMAFGVIAPLFFLSAEPGHSKTILLILFIPLSLGFVAYLAYEVARIRRAADLSRAIF